MSPPSPRRTRRQNAGRPNLIHGVNPVSTAAFRHVQRVVENRQSAEVIVFPWLVRGFVAHLRDREFANLVDVRRHGGACPGTNSSTPVEVIRFTPTCVPVSWLADSPPLLSLPSHVVERMRLNRRPPVVSAVPISFRNRNVPVGVYFRNRPVVLRRNRIRRIDYSRRIRVRNIQLVRPRHKSRPATVCRQT